MRKFDFLSKCKSNSAQPIIPFKKPEINETSERSLYFRDVAIFRYKNSHVKIFSDSEFLNIFLKRTNDPYWQKIDYIQTNIKAKIGIGEAIFVDFYADLSHRNSFRKK